LNAIWEKAFLLRRRLQGEKRAIVSWARQKALISGGKSLLSDGGNGWGKKEEGAACREPRTRVVLEDRPKRKERRKRADPPINGVHLRKSVHFYNGSADLKGGAGAAGRKQIREKEGPHSSDFAPMTDWLVSLLPVSGRERSSTVTELTR